MKPEPQPFVIQAPRFRGISGQESQTPACFLRVNSFANSLADFQLSLDKRAHQPKIQPPVKIGKSYQPICRYLKLWQSPPGTTGTSPSITQPLFEVTPNTLDILANTGQKQLSFLTTKSRRIPAN